MLRTPLVCFLGLWFLAVGACSDEAAERAATLARENEALRAQVTALNKELVDLREGPGPLLTKVESAISTKDWAAAKAASDKLATRFPLSPEAEKIKTRKGEVEAGMARAEAKKKAAADQKKEAERQKKAQEERRIAAAVQKLNKSTDKVEKTDWYRDKSSPAYTNHNGFFIYIGKAQNSPPWLRLRIQYAADDWLFIESFLVDCNG